MGNFQKLINKQDVIRHVGNFQKIDNLARTFITGPALE